MRPRNRSRSLAPSACSALLRRAPASIAGAIFLAFVFLLVLIARRWLPVSGRRGRVFAGQQTGCLVAVQHHSAAANFLERQAVRLTWGATARTMGMPLSFVVGLPGKTSDHEDADFLSSSDMVRNSLEAEQQMHQDLIVVTIAEEHRSKAFLTAGGLAAFAKRDPSSGDQCQYLFKVNRNIYVRPPRLLALLKRVNSDGAGASTDSLQYIGKMWMEGRIVRDPKNKHYLSAAVIESLGPQATFYPPYASGSAYLLSAALVHRLVDAKFGSCYTASKVLPGPDDCQLGICVDRLAVRSDSDPIHIIRTRAMHANHASGACNGKTVVSSLSTDGGAGKALFAAHQAYLTGVDDCRDGGAPTTFPRVLIGVTTSLKSFEKRVGAIVRTWGKPSRLDPARVVLRFFVGSDVQDAIYEACDRAGISHKSVVVLPGIKDDEYPPVLKNTAMLRRMSEMMGKPKANSGKIDNHHTGNDNDNVKVVEAEQERIGYSWALKVDDDSLVNVRALFKVLRHFKSDEKDIYLGQRGTGLAKDRGRLGIVKPFCMGGPGYALSRKALLSVGPHLSKCAHDFRARVESGELHHNSWHSDVIIGLCLYKYLQIGCWDTHPTSVIRYPFDERPEDHLFFHRYQNGELRINWPRGNALLDKITFHPLKKPELMQSMYEKLQDAILIGQY